MNLDYLKNIMEEIDEDEMQDIDGGCRPTENGNTIWQYFTFGGC